MIKLHNLGGTIINSYVLETPDCIIAIDTGYPGGFKKFKERFEKRWPLSALKYIFLTHHHDDHAGFLGELLEKTEADVILHPAAVKHLAAGKSNEPPGAGYSSWTGFLFGKIKRDFSFPPVRIEERALLVHNENEQLFESMGWPVRIVFLPGHTPDSIGLLLTETGEFLCGDAAMNGSISTARHTIWIEDAAAFGRSWDKMLSFNPTKICPSHGAPFSPQDLVKYRHYMDGRKLIV